MSTLKVNTIQNASGVEKYLCQAWVNFNGTGTVAIRAAGNVSSITDNGTGSYAVNFTTAMPDANYSSVAGTGDHGPVIASPYFYSPATSNLYIEIFETDGTPLDPGYTYVVVFR